MADLTITEVTPATGYPPPTYKRVGRATNVALSIGDVLRLAGRYDKASASGASQNTAGMATAAVPANGVLLPLESGFVELGPTLTPGGLYFVSRTGGKIMPFDDLQHGDEVAFALLAVSTSIANFYPFPSGATFDGQSAMPTGALVGDVTPGQEIHTVQIQAAEALSQGDLVWFDFAAGGRKPATKLGASTSVVAGDPSIGVVSHDIAAGEAGIAYQIFVRFSESTIIEGHPYVAASTAGQIVPYSDITDDTRLRVVGVGIQDNVLRLFLNGLDTLTNTFTYTAPDGPVTLVSDTFTDTNATLPADHTMDVGDGWVEEVAGFTIQGNKLQGNSAVGSPYTNRISVTGTLSGAWTSHSVTVIWGDESEATVRVYCRYKDQSNYIIVSVYDQDTCLLNVVGSGAAIAEDFGILSTPLTEGDSVTITVSMTPSGITASFVTDSETIALSANGSGVETVASQGWTSKLEYVGSGHQTGNAKFDDFSIARQPIVV